MATATSTNDAILTSRCGFCNATESLLRCARCKVMFYCNREHQTAHWKAHKHDCSFVANQQANVAAEERKLREHPGDIFTPPGHEVFEKHVGHFWGILETRDYMRSRYALVEALQKIQTHDSVQAQLDHLLDMLRLCRGDNMGVRSIVPAVMLRLNKDQECYDFIKWWTMTAEEGDYDFGDTDIPYMDLRNANAFESVQYYVSREFADLSHSVSLALLKIKLLLDLKALQHSATAVGTKVPSEILGAIQSHIPRSPIVTGNKEIMQRGDHSAAIHDLAAQIDALYRMVKKMNRRFWPRLVDPGQHLTARPEYFSSGSEEEMQLVLQYSYQAWIEMPGPLKIIKAKLKGIPF
jgi:MYND finger